VTWEDHSDDVEDAEVGTVVGFTTELVCVKFQNGVFQLAPDAVAAVEQCELFAVGDAVTLTEDAEVEGVDTYEGMVGLCMEPADDGWTVKFGKTEVTVSAAQLILAGKGFETKKGKNGILVGDWVQWTQANDSVPNGTYGSVIEFDGEQAACKFGDQMQFMAPAELVVKARKYISADCTDGKWFSTRDEVTWGSRADDDIPEGDTGKVMELRLENVTAKFAAKGKVWSLKAYQLELLSRSGFKVGDQVVWTKSDDDIPPGTVGTVTKLNAPKFAKLQAQSIITVKFPKGAWIFKPGQLAISTGEEEEEAPVEGRETFVEKHALLVGCTYLGLKSHLKGVARDVYRAHAWLQKPPLSIPVENIVVLSDDPACAKACNAVGKPTQLNIKKSMRDLQAKSGPGTLQFML